jgi:hypothetical protein
MIPQSVANISSYSLAKIKQNMQLLNGDLSLADMDHALSAQTLAHRYDPETKKRAMTPRRVSPHKKHPGVSGSKAKLTKYGKKSLK